MQVWTGSNHITLWNKYVTETFDV